MDNITHTLTGVVLARAGLARRHGRGTTLLLALASNLPDVDVLVSLSGSPYAFLLRRTLTHSVFGLPLVCLALALAFKVKQRKRSLASLFGLSLLGAGTHVFMDLINSYGVVVLFPLSRARFELAWTFIIDLAIWTILATPLVLSLVRRLARRAPVGELPFRASLAVLALYLGLCALGHFRAVSLVGDAARSVGMRPDFACVFPEPLGPHRFRGVAREGPLYRSWLVHVWTGRAEDAGTVRTNAYDPDVAAVRQRPEVRRLEQFYKAPVWTRLPETGEVAVRDLRFSSAVLDRRPTAFSRRFPLDGKASKP